MTGIVTFDVSVGGEWNHKLKKNEKKTHLKSFTNMLCRSNKEKSAHTHNVPKKSESYMSDKHTKRLFHT